MPSQHNINRLNDLKDLLSQAKVVVLNDYSGLSVKLQTELRQKVKEAGGQFIVAKNTLFKLALKDKGQDVPQSLEDALQGPTAFLFALADELAPLKALSEFSEKNALPKTKLGFLRIPEDRVLTPEEVDALAKLPTRDQLLIRLVETLSTPSHRLVNSISGNMVKLLYILTMINQEEKTADSLTPNS